MNQPAKPDASPQILPSGVGQNLRTSIAHSSASTGGRRALGVSSRVRASLALLAGTLASAPLTAPGGEWEGTPWADYRRGGPPIHRGPGPIYRTLDAVAGGIERAFGLHARGHGCDEASCDDGCDETTLRSLVPGYGHSLPPGMTSPHPGFTPAPLQPIGPPSGRTPSHDPPSTRTPSTRTPSTRMPRTESLPTHGSDDDDSGSFFDTLSDPFEDDSAGLRPVRPGVATQDSSALRPFGETTAPMGLQPVSVTTPARR